MNRLISRSAGFEVTLATVEVRSNNTILMNVTYRNINATTSSLTCESNTPDSYLQQGSARGTQIDEWCGTRRGTSTLLSGNGVHTEWTLFSRGSIDLSRPFSLYWGGWQSVDNIVLR